MIRTAAFAALMLGIAPLAANAQTACTTSTPVDLPILQAAIDGISNGGANDGSYSFAGTAECPTTPVPQFDASDALALSAALSTPVWLGDKENFAVSGGLGFTDGAAAVGATGVVRINQSLSAFAGGAVSTDNSDVWAGRAGLRVGW